MTCSVCDALTAELTRTDGSSLRLRQMNPVTISRKMQNTMMITNEHKMPEISGSARRNTASLEMNISLISLKTATFKRSHHVTVVSSNNAAGTEGCTSLSQSPAA